MKKRNSLFFFFTALTLILLLTYYYMNKRSQNYNNLKIDSAKKLVYTSFINQAGEYYQYIPYVNINNKLGTDINNNIREYVSQFEKTNIGITYEYNINGKVLSLIIKVHDHSLAESATIFSFRSYNINLKELLIVSNSTLLEYYDISENDIQSSLEKGFENYYQELINNNIIDTDNCNYDCFMKGREFNNNLEDIQYYVRDGKLVVFKPYVSFSYQEEEEQIYDFEITS